MVSRLINKLYLKNYELKKVLIVLARVPLRRSDGDRICRGLLPFSVYKGLTV